MQTCLICWAQQTAIKGKIINKNTNETVSSVSVLIKDNPSGTYTDEKGGFVLSAPSLPVTLIVSSIGYETQELTVTNGEPVVVSLNPFTAIGQEVVVAATRIPTKILQSPVSIERIGLNALRNTPTTSYYDRAAYLKGVDVTTSSLTFKTISTRGFNGSGSTRVNQLVDGMDNQAPGLNFFVGNFVGLTELDVESMELLPGASSALYGPGGMNGTVLITSKNPFKYQGLSVLVKEGVNHVNDPQGIGASAFHDFSLRWAKAFHNKFAFKIGAQYIRATDWVAGDSSNYLRRASVGKVIPGNRQTDPNYDGVNVYGDETSINIYNVAQQMAAGGYIPSQAVALVPNTNVSRTGYNEKDFIDPKTKNIKLSAAFHYKLTPNLEAQLMGYWATGSTIYTGDNRYVLKNIKLGQYKLELKHPNWFLRGYTTQEDGGDAYSATISAQYFNEAWKPSATWYPQYVGAFVQARSQGVSEQQAHLLARSFADIGRPEAGSGQFQQIFNQVIKVPIPNGGRFQEKSQLWMAEGQYNFSRAIKVAELIVGANLKRYILNSEGTLFIDTTGAIHINEAGAYAQITKKLLKEALTLSFSGRYDKNEDFKGVFTPRATVLIRVAKDNNLRFSYQTAYRFASTLQKYIRLDAGEYTLLGGLPWVMDYLNVKSNPVVEIIDGVPDSKPYVYQNLKPESVSSFEVGYKGLVTQKLLVDAYGYWGRYTDFLGRNILLQVTTGKIFSTVVNSPTKVKTYGYGLGLDYRLPKNFSVFFNAYSDVITDVPKGFQAYFNTPKYRLNTGLANSGFGKNNAFIFNALLHWQDAFMWEGELANGPVNAFTSVDAQIGYKVSKLHSVIKLGGTNIFNHYYKNGFANPQIGGLYYVSVGYNIY